MARRRLLGRSSKGSRGGRRPKSLVVMGVEENVGVTHFSIMLANYLKKKRFKVGILECQESGDFLKIEQAYEGASFTEDETGWFRIRGIDFYKCIQQETLNLVYQAAYDYIILDVGREINGYRDEINRADQNFVIGYFSDWKRDNYQQFVERYLQNLSNRCQLLIQEGEGERCRELNRLTGYKSGSISFQQDPFITNKKTKESFRKIMGV